MAKTWAYEDFVVGAVLPLGEKSVNAAEIIEFASEFDPQPMHLDEEAGKVSILGGLAASGWHSCSMLMRLLCDGFILDSTSQGSPGIDYVRWKLPVLAGDVLIGTTIITAKRLSKSRPTVGLVTLKSQLENQRGQLVLELENTCMFLTRQAAGAI